MARSSKLTALSLVALVLTGCSSADDDRSSVAAEEIRRAEAHDLPWEVSSPEGESVVPNVFYAEASENEQIAPLTIDGKHVIDRLIYPTIGNPNLFVRSESDESFLMVMRLEKELLAHLAPRMESRPGDGQLVRLELSESERDRLAFYAVARSARASATESNGPVAAVPGAIALRPTALLVHAIPGDMPEAFKARWTVRAIFDRAAMSVLSAGLYDVRMEVLKGGAIARAPGGALAYEAHYNALRVFDRPLASIVNVTDTQVTAGTALESKTLTKLKELVTRLTSSTDPSVRDAAFITFNGDLHNGGSPEAVAPLEVATTYQNEAKAILATLKDLPLPIFLTMGNHDGYASTGHAPDIFSSALADLLGHSLPEAIDSIREPLEWPGYSRSSYEGYLAATTSTMGGRHLDIFSGAHMRRPATTFAKGWLPVARARRNVMLYDGVHQWQRTYGPTYTSWRYGKTRFVNLDSYDLRQHRRTGWGMYTVNYGGSLSKVQLDWATRELDRAETAAEDVVLIAHHDPRGGHKGKDYPFYFEQLEYAGLRQSLGNYLRGEVFGPALCTLVPSWAQSDEQKKSCLHDGLQEWMRPDPELDCEDGDRLWGDPDGRCDVWKMAELGKQHWYSGFAVLDAIYRHPRVRTLLLGHTHYNSLEVASEGDALVPARSGLDPSRTASYESASPLRAESLARSHPGGDRQTFIDDAAQSILDLERAGGSFARHALEGAGRELVILRLTCNADLTSQKQDGRAMYGFATFGLSRRPGYDAPQINDVTFFVNDGGRFEQVRRVPIDRTKRIGNADTDPTNPLRGVFDNFGE